MKNIRLFFWLAALAFFASIIINVSYINLDPDLGWHLKVGQDILTNHALPHDQIYMRTLPGQTWVDHEWLTNIGMYLIYQIFTYIGLVLVFVSLVLLGLWLSISQSVHKYHGQDVVIFLWAFLGLMGYQWHFGTRAQVITWLLLICLFTLIKKWQASHQLKYLYSLPLLFWLWASLHAGFLIGLVVLANYVFFEAVWPWLKKRQSWQQAKAPIIIALGSFVATWLTPYGYKLYSFLTGYANSRYLDIVTEWRAIYVPPLQYWQLIFLAVVVAVFISSQIFSEAKQKLKLADLLIVTFFACLAVRSIRHFPLFYAASCFTILPYFLKSQVDSFTYVRYDKRWLIPTLALFLVSLLVMTRQEFIKDPFTYYCAKYPCAGVQYIKDHPELLKLNWLNHYNIGGYLIWTLPEARLYIDGRMPQTNYHGKTLIEDFIDFFDNKSGLAKLDAEKIDLIFWQKIPKVNDNSLLNKVGLFSSVDTDSTNKPFRQMVAESPNWQLIFEDQASLIWVRRR